MIELPKHLYGNEHFIVKDKEGKELLLSVLREEYPASPREWDNFGKMVCWHRRYDLGDKHETRGDKEKFSDPQEFLRCLASGKSPYQLEDEENEWLNEYETDYPLYLKSNQELIDIITEDHVILPLYLYDHSGISMSVSKTYPYTDRWDAEQVGWIYVDKRTILDAIGDGVGGNWREAAEELLKQEVKDYNYYLTGDVFEYRLLELNGDAVGKIVDGCGGFFEDSIHHGLSGYTVVRQVELRKETKTFIQGTT